MLRHLSFILFLAWNYQGLYAQFVEYKIIEKDSIVSIITPIQLKNKNSFSLRINEALNNHPYYLLFILTNLSDTTFTVQLGSEGVMTPITKTIVLKPKDSQLITYQFKNVRTPGTSFSQAGRIRGYASDMERNLVKDIHSFQSFLISGTWKLKQ